MLASNDRSTSEEEAALSMLIPSLRLDQVEQLDRAHLKATLRVLEPLLCEALGLVRVLRSTQ